MTSVDGPFGVEVWRGGVNTWECDEMGHMNVRFYVAHFMEGLAGLALRLGLPEAFTPGATATLSVREHHIRFLREARPGGALAMTGGVVELGETDALILQTLSHTPSGEPCATVLTRVDHATPAGRVFPWPARTRQAAAGLMVEVPANAGPRSLDPSPPSLAASLEAADRLGAPCTGRAVVGPADTDAFGRLRTELFIGRVSEATGVVLLPVREAVAAGAPEATRLGGAALEYRLVYLAAPRVGQHLELRSALRALGDKTMHLAHWVLDPVSGQPWAVAESVGANLDLDARRLVPIAPAAREAILPWVIEEMRI